MDALARKISSFTFQYADADPAALQIIEKRLAEAGRKETTISYSDLVQGIEFRLPMINAGLPYTIKTFEWTGLDRKIIGDFLAKASCRTYIAHGFWSNVLVVTKEELRPGWHFFTWMHYLGVLPNLEEDTVNEFWITELKKAHNWYSAKRRPRTE